MTLDSCWGSLEYSNGTLHSLRSMRATWSKNDQFTSWMTFECLQTYPCHSSLKALFSLVKFLGFSSVWFAPLVSQVTLFGLRITTSAECCWESLTCFEASLWIGKVAQLLGQANGLLSARTCVMCITRSVNGNLRLTPSSWSESFGSLAILTAPLWSNCQQLGTFVKSQLALLTFLRISHRTHFTFRLIWGWS